MAGMSSFFEAEGRATEPSSEHLPIRTIDKATSTPVQSSTRTQSVGGAFKSVMQRRRRRRLSFRDDF